jgi:hypothetical protein
MFLDGVDRADGHRSHWQTIIISTSTQAVMLLCGSLLFAIALIMSVVALSRHGLKTLLPVFKGSLASFPLSSTLGAFKCFIYFLLLLNIKSAPLTWHCQFLVFMSKRILLTYLLYLVRICRLIMYYRLRKLRTQINLLLQYPLSPKIRASKFNDWYDSNMSPVGFDPFRSVSVYCTRASEYPSYPLSRNIRDLMSPFRLISDR